ncbi:hypothetical protein IWQ61_005514 [Dispira simplex]|nr:hypothetical protein IWQ61_005514 [Dispira simplex]
MFLDQQHYFFHFYWLQYFSQSDFAHPEKLGLYYDSVRNDHLTTPDGVKLGFRHILSQSATNQRDFPHLQEPRGVLDCLTKAFENQLKVISRSAHQIVVYSHSLSTGLSVELCHQLAQQYEYPQALCLENPFECLAKLSLEYRDILLLKPIASFKLLCDTIISKLSHRLPSIQYLLTLNIPVLIIHGQADELVKLDHTYRLFLSLYPCDTTALFDVNQLDHTVMMSKADPESLDGMGCLYKWD